MVELSIYLALKIIIVCKQRMKKSGEIQYIWLSIMLNNAAGNMNTLLRFNVIHISEQYLDYQRFHSHLLIAPNALSFSLCTLWLNVVWRFGRRCCRCCYCCCCCCFLLLIYISSFFFFMMDINCVCVNNCEIISSLCLGNGNVFYLCTAVCLQKFQGQIWL